METLANYSLVNKALFPAPPPSYPSHWSELVWVPVPFVGNADVCENTNFVPAHFVSYIGSHKILLYFHGNGCDVGQMQRDHHEYATRFKVNLLAIEYPGYGPCGGEYASASGCNQHAKAAYDFVTQELHVRPCDVIVFGRSIGTGVATELVALMEDQGVTLNALILQSPYLSVKTLAKSLVGWASNLMLDRFVTKTRILKVKCPLLIIHGVQAQLIPYQHAQKLHDLCTSDKKELFLAGGADHNYFHAERHILGPIADFLHEVFLEEVEKGIEKSDNEAGEEKEKHQLQDSQPDTAAFGEGKGCADEEEGLVVPRSYYDVPKKRAPKRASKGGRTQCMGEKRSGNDGKFRGVLNPVRDFCCYIHS